jgi:hypothetical protein
MSNTSRSLICCAYPFGYGPAAKLLHIARKLRAKPLRLVFLGTGIAHELASRSDLFDEVVQATPNDPRVPQLLQSACGLLSLMDRDYSAVAVEIGVPIYVADSLLWMRDRVPHVFRQARRYWAQDFVDVRQRLGEVGPQATLVGPIVASSDSVSTGEGTRLVVNLGGCESPGGSIADDPAYTDFVMRGILESGLLAGRRSGDVLIAGECCVRSLHSRYAECGLEIMSASHESALTLLRQARCVLTAPGLTATLECFQLGVPTFFLPPQNYSQWWILKKLRDRGLAPASFHWADFHPGCDVTERMSEEMRGPLVRNAIQRLSHDKTAQGQFIASLATAQGSDLADLARRQHAFFATLGSNGAVQIVDELMQCVFRA